MKNIDRREADKLVVLTEGLLGGDPSAAIERSEWRGQGLIVNSSLLPAPPSAEQSRFEELGIVFGAPVDGDPLFVQATLPPGWTREGSEHAMHSFLVDENAEKRVDIFYKAAFYDRRADMRIIPQCGSCHHSKSRHPYVGVLEPASADNRWRGTSRPEPCTREHCGCRDFVA